MMRSTKVLGPPSTGLICVCWWLVVFRFGLGRGRKARSSREQRMHKRESEKAQKKAFVAMAG